VRRRAGLILVLPVVCVVRARCRLVYQEQRERCDRRACLCLRADAVRVLTGRHSLRNEIIKVPDELIAGSSELFDSLLRPLDGPLECLVRQCYTHVRSGGHRQGEPRLDQPVVVRPGQLFGEVDVDPPQQGGIRSAKRRVGAKDVKVVAAQLKM